MQRSLACPATAAVPKGMLRKANPLPPSRQHRRLQDRLPNFRC